MTVERKLIRANIPMCTDGCASEAHRITLGPGEYYACSTCHRVTEHPDHGYYAADTDVQNTAMCGESYQAGYEVGWQDYHEGNSRDPWLQKAPGTSKLELPVRVAVAIMRDDALVSGARCSVHTTLHQARRAAKRASSAHQAGSHQYHVAWHELQGASAVDLQGLTAENEKLRAELTVTQNRLADWKRREHTARTEAADCLQCPHLGAGDPTVDPQAAELERLRVGIADVKVACGALLHREPASCPACTDCPNLEDDTCTVDPSVFGPCTEYVAWEQQQLRSDPR